jgi:hypothetical protein
MKNMLVSQHKNLPIIMRNSTQLSPGEYLGDVNLKQIHQLLKSLTNINEAWNSLNEIPQPPEWLVFADFDYEGDGRFIGLRLIPRKKK